LAAGERERAAGCGRAAVEVSLVWSDGAAKTGTLRPKLAKSQKIAMPQGVTKVVVSESGNKSIEIPNQNGLLELRLNPGHEYVLQFTG
jgi:hypothetical protein